MIDDNETITQSFNEKLGGISNILNYFRNENYYSTENIQPSQFQKTHNTLHLNETPCPLSFKDHTLIVQADSYSSLSSSIPEKCSNMISVENLDQNFTSRDLVKLFIHLTVNKVNEFSLKGIKYWEMLSQDTKYEILFKRYKPWTLHTAYKRLFCKASIEEVSKMLSENPRMDMNELTKRLRKIGIKKKKLENKRQHIRKINRLHSKGGVEHQTSKQNAFQLLNAGDENIKNTCDNNNNNNNNNISNFDYHIQSQFGKLISPHCLPSTFIGLIEDIPQDSHKDKLSDVFDMKANEKQGYIKHVPYSIYKKLSYIKFAKSNFRKFCINDDSSSSLVKDIQELHKKYSYDMMFIFESLMRLSSDIADLECYLQNPVMNSDLLWTEVEDRIIMESKDIVMIDHIKELKGEGRYYQRLEFLKSLFRNDCLLIDN